MKQKTILLSYPHYIGEENFVGHPSGFQVERVTNSVDPPVGAMMTKADVDKLCKHKEWEVVIIPTKQE